MIQVFLGFDQTINLWTIQEGKISNPTVSIPCNQVVSSVRWHPYSTLFFLQLFLNTLNLTNLLFLGPMLFSWSTDPGTMVQYDTRIGAICWKFSVFIQHVRNEYFKKFNFQKSNNYSLYNSLGLVSHRWLILP